MDTQRTAFTLVELLVVIAIIDELIFKALCTRAAGDTVKAF